MPERHKRGKRPYRPRPGDKARRSGIGHAQRALRLMDFVDPKSEQDDPARQEVWPHARGAVAAASDAPVVEKMLNRMKLLRFDMTLFD